MFKTHNYNLEFWFLLLIIIGYHVISSFAIPLQIENSRYFSVPFRMFIFLFSLVIIIRNYEPKKNKNISFYAFVLFWIFYLIKTYISLKFDFYSANFLAESKEIYVRVLFIVFFPSIAMFYINYQKIEYQKLIIYSFYTILVLLTINFIFGLFYPIKDFKLRYIFSVYYISYGHIGASLAIISLFLLKINSFSISKSVLFYGLFLGLLTILIGSARSPFLAVIISMFYLFVLMRNKKEIAIFIGIVLSVIAVIFLYKKLGYSGISFVDRTYLWIFEGDNSLRTPLFKRGIDIFKDHPFFGGRTHYEDGMYPHNIFLELLMATGIVGLILYFLKFISLVKNLKQFFNFKAKNTVYYFFFALFIQYFVLVLTSFTLYSVPEFIYFSAIVIGISLNIKNEKT